MVEKAKPRTAKKVRPIDEVAVNAVKEAKAKQGITEDTKREKVSVVVRSTYFDNMRRHRVGSKLEIEVPIVDGQPKLPLWAATPSDWEIELEEQKQEVEANKKKGVRGGASGGVQL